MVVVIKLKPGEYKEFYKQLIIAFIVIGGPIGLYLIAAKRFPFLYDSSLLMLLKWAVPLAIVGTMLLMGSYTRRFFKPNETIKPFALKLFGSLGYITGLFGYVMVLTFLCLGLIQWGNGAFDHNLVTTNAKIIRKYIESYPKGSRNPTLTFVVLVPQVGEQKGFISVPQSVFNKFNAGDQIRLQIGHGVFNIPWFVGIEENN